MSYAIKTPSGYVTGFNGERFIVQVNPDVKRAKRWPTIAAATCWLHGHADMGAGLSIKTATVEAVK